MTDPAELLDQARANASLAEIMCERAEAKRKEAEKLHPKAKEWIEAYRCERRALIAMTRAYDRLMELAVR